MTPAQVRNEQGSVGVGIYVCNYSTGCEDCTETVGVGTQFLFRACAGVVMPLPHIK